MWNGFKMSLFQKITILSHSKYCILAFSKVMRHVCYRKTLELPPYKTEGIRDINSNNSNNNNNNNLTTPN